jgi:soluble lytic murein transglycosylase
VNLNRRLRKYPARYLGGLLSPGVVALMLTVLFFCLPAAAQNSANPASSASQREQFSRAWLAATHGQRDVFNQTKPLLQNYVLYPYLQYEDLRFRRASVGDEEMAEFLDAHQDWAFSRGLRTSWLNSLGQRARWDSLLKYATESGDTEIKCYLAQARIARGQTDGLLPVAQQLWTVGKSQPDACDPVFVWLGKQKGITPGLAWERIRLAMEAREPRLTLYLARYLDSDNRVWAERWQQQDRGGYRRLSQATQWPDVEKSRVISSYGLRRLARNDPDRAWQSFETLDDHLKWSVDVRAAILREIALWSAVEGSAQTAARMRQVPEDYRDGKLLEWWVRSDLARSDWAAVILTIASMPAELKDNARWRYWEARARIHMGDTEQAQAQLSELALEASYYGFLSADYMEQPYSICAQEPGLAQVDIDALRKQPDFQRALELRNAGMRNWSRSEWVATTNGLDRDGLRLAAALAIEENWSEMAIFALGNSGDLRWYEWRFPVEYGALVASQSQNWKLDPSWVMGLMRSESAMAEDALSPAGARGLMQLMPDTARQLAKRHKIQYSGRQQLMQPESNIALGTAYLRELFDRFDENPVLVAGAYNAGPHRVDRWLKSQPAKDPQVWIETLPYFETRDYIPRVLAFSTIYDWRLQQPAVRISSRMPAFDSGSMGNAVHKLETTQVVCRVSG